MPTAAPERLVRQPGSGSQPAEAEPAPRPLTGGAVMASASRVVTAVTGAAATVLVARLLGPSGAGGYAIAQTLILLLMVATTLGVEHGIVYYVSAGRWRPARAGRAAARMALIAGLAGAGLALGARDLFPAAFGNLSFLSTAVAACALPCALGWFYLSYLAVAADWYEGFALAPALQSMLALVLVGALAALWGLPGAVAGFAAAHLLTALGAAIATRRRFPRPDSTRDGEARLLDVVGFGVKGYAANALQVLNNRLDLFILAAAAGAGAVGHYAVAVAVTGVLWLLPQALSDVLFPRIAALNAGRGTDSVAALEFIETKCLRHTVLVVSAMTCVIGAALLLLVVPVYGAAFRPAIGLGLILLPGVALLGLANPITATLAGRGRPGYLLATTLVVTPLTVVLYLVLIPALHATGAALASTASYTCSFFLIALLYRRVTGRSLRRCLLPTGSELADYRALIPALRRWVAGRRGPRRSNQGPGTIPDATSTIRSAGPG